MSKTILVVDDSKTLRISIAGPLQEEGFNVIEAEDGILGIAALEGADEVHLILADVNMPNMDGLTMVENIKGMDEYKHIPILMLTTEASPDIKAKGLALGVRAWATKPLKPAKVIGAVKKLAL